MRTTGTTLLAAVVAASACEARAPRPAAPEAATTSAPTDVPVRIRLSAEVTRTTGIATERARLEALPRTVEVTGELAMDPRRTAVITARAPGRVVEVRCRAGEAVTAGQVLAVVESPDLARARAAATSAGARAKVTRHRAQRIARLSARGLASQEEEDAAAAEAEVQGAESLAAGQVLAAFGAGAQAPATEAARLELRAPIDGFVLEQRAIGGQTVAPDVVLMQLGRLDRAYFSAHLFEKDLQGIRSGGAAEVHLNAYPGATFRGVVESIDKQIEQTARTVIARIVVDDHDELLKSGLFGVAEIGIGASGDDAPRPTVPHSAVAEVSGREVVFVEGATGDFEARPVRLGRRSSARVEVLEGLHPSERVVTAGTFSLKSIAMKRSFGEDAP